jgi:hypothetical protein
MSDRTKNIHERFLRHIWSRQYLDRARLSTCDGKSLTILHVGRLNLDGGPDFSDAKIRIGNTTYAGDVEIHRNVVDWFNHQHHDDPRYNRVILHVVLEGNPRHYTTRVLSGRSIPTLILSEFLTEPIHSIWQKAILDERARRSETIRCAPRNRGIDPQVLASWLRRLATERLELKLRRFEERLKELTYEDLMTVFEHPKTYGEPATEGYPDEIPPPLKELTLRDLSRKELWEQVMYEGLMEGLGYAKNREPFLRLARNLSLRQVRSLGLARDDNRRIAVLFSVAGLLPKIKSVDDKRSKEYVRELIRLWNEVGASVNVGKLHPADWQFFPTRPGNFPTLRISAANTLIDKLLNNDLFRRIIQTLKSIDDGRNAQQALAGLLSVRADDFWRSHYDFGQPTKNPIAALGVSRIQDLIINTVVPIALLYARIFKDSAIRENALRCYDSFPPLAENSVTRLLERQLLRGTLPVQSASRQQGLIQLYKYYCTVDRCADCEIGALVFEFN